MEALPYELLEDIFILAFTDGGRTACSVSLVSRRMRHLSSRYRFHSVALRSRTLQIASFLATFALARARYREAGPVLRHLYIASPATSSYHWFSRYVHDPDGWPHFGTAFVGHALALLALVASELTTLVLVQCPSELLDPIGRTGFPNLQELTIVGGRELVFATHGEVIAIHAPEPLYPRLVRLNLISPVVLFSHWSTHAPHVTHLRLSGSARQDYIDEDIRNVLLRNLRAGDVPSIFPDLERFVVQTYHIPRSFQSLRNPRSSPALARFTEVELTQMHEDGHHGFELRPTSTFQSVEELESATHRDWVNRVGGGAGCWTGDGHELSC